MKVPAVWAVIFSWVAGGAASAETGYDLWLRYRPVEDAARRSAYRQLVSAIVVQENTPTGRVVESELQRGLRGLLGAPVPVAAAVSADGAVVVGTATGSPLVAARGWGKDLTRLGDEGYLIRSTRIGLHSVTVIAAHGEAGTLYGAFHFLRLIQTGQPVAALDVAQRPRLALRLLNHWDNLDGSIERGYAGPSLWAGDERPGPVARPGGNESPARHLSGGDSAAPPDPRVVDYARANASIGLNGTVINSVNADPESLSPRYLEKTAALAAALRPYGIRVYLSANFAAPKLRGGLPTADPRDPAVARWWRDKADEIYRLIPDFGGFLVKANSEGQPGPQDYGRTHADGANVLADAVGPHRGIVMWRAFVYDAHVDADRVKRAYTEFAPLDGRFRDNVFVQVKNGPLDFQPREPFHPLYGAMPRTPLMAELQITQEYLGQSTHLVYLAPMWKEFLDADTYARGPGSLVARIVDGTLEGHERTGIAGVANTGRDANWCGHHFAQANWYAFGRLAWDPGLGAGAIADEWIRMTWGDAPDVVAAIRSIMLDSREAFVDYSMPLGLHHLIGGDHYAPMPENTDPRRADWSATYYHRADGSGIGYDRTRSGSDAVDQYRSPLPERWSDPATVPENLLLWFQRLPWDHRLRSGRTLWEELVVHYRRGAEAARGFEARWKALEGRVDPERHLAVLGKLRQQAADAAAWSDRSLRYFQAFSQRPLPDAVRAGGDPPALKALVPRGLLVGVAINQRQSDGQDPVALGIVTTHFNAISPENLLKWASVHPEPDRYAFEAADRYVAFGLRHGMTVIGHTLVWHRQTPDWVFAGTEGGRPDRETLLARMRAHIHAVVGRYRGRIHGWDVVNEALEDDGSPRPTPWREAIGDDYIAKAFEYAHEADPEAELYYNDYNLWKPEKRAAALRIVRQLKERGLRIDAVGEQGHWTLTRPSIAEIEATVTAIRDAGVRPQITELDVDVLPRDPATDDYRNGLPEAKQLELARRYADIFALLVKHGGELARVTFWGVTDAMSWLNNFPIRGRTNHPLLWDREGRPKPAFAAVVGALGGRLDFEARAADLVSRMTVDEKVSQLMNDAPAIPRLDIPAYEWWNECLHGVARAGAATVFPQAIGMAASFDKALMREVATAISDEARAKHHEFVRRGQRGRYQGLTFWSPNINIFRDPRWGRGQETYGEDPYLTARMGVEFVKGLQGDDPRYLKVVATAKHFAVHSGPEPDRHHFDARPSERDLFETYLPAFRALVQEGRAASIMGAYNRVNGESASASPRLLGDILRRDWGFDGYVVSDCGAIDDIQQGHQIVSTPEAAAALGVRNGCDLECGSVYRSLPAALARGLISEPDIDAAVRRLMRARFELGMFDPPERVRYAHIPYAVNQSEEHDRLARRMAQESIVLLKNDGLLPLSRGLGTIAVVGPNADEVMTLLGNYYGTPAKPVTVLAGIRSAVGAGTKVLHARGADLVEGRSDPRAVPAIDSAFLRAGAGDTPAGLRGEYFRGRELQGPPMLTRVDPTVDFRWDRGSPTSDLVARGELPADRAIPDDDFSVRWTGQLRPPVSGRYELTVMGDDGFRLDIDGRRVIDEWTTTSRARARSASLDLQAGRAYDVRLEYFEAIRDAEIRLGWRLPGAKDPVDEALDAARAADVVVFVGGLTGDVEGEEMRVSYPGFAGGDRSDITLPATQDRLLRALHATGKPVVLVLTTGSAIAVEWAQQNLPAIVVGWYPGQQGGNAIADVLFGEISPAGRLPVTFYKSVDQLPPFADYDMKGRTYRYFEGEPRYPFGYGLSYTRFEYSDLRIERAGAGPRDAVAVSLSVKNAGSREGDEVVQLYARAVAPSMPMPLKQLRGFERIPLKPGEERRVAFRLTPGEDLAHYDVAGKVFVVEPGEYEIQIGASSRDIRLAARVRVP